MGRAIRNDRYRIVEWKENDSDIVYELYDYQEDPLETANIAGSDPAALATMKALLALEPPAKPQALRRR